MNKNVCMFLGNNNINVPDYIIEKAMNIVINLIENCNVNKFYFGGYNNFDNIMAKQLDKLKAKYKIKLYFITPYININYSSKLYYNIKSNIYDEIIYPAIEKVPIRYAIVHRNRFMIKNSSYVISYLPIMYRNSCELLNYANRCNLISFNLE